MSSPTLSTPKATPSGSILEGGKPGIKGDFFLGKKNESISQNLLKILKLQVQYITEILGRKGKKNSLYFKYYNLGVLIKKIAFIFFEQF